MHELWTLPIRHKEHHMDNKSNKQQPSPFRPDNMAMTLSSLCLALSGMLAATQSSADNYYPSYGSTYGSYNNNDYSNNPASIKQPKIRWYRYYDSTGQAHLSNSITTEQMKYGYEALDRNMQVVKKVEPYSAEQYAVQKAQRDAALAKKTADLELRKSYGSSMAAAAKRDQILADMTSRRNFLVSQLTTLQATLSKNIAQAADLERQQKPIPPMLKQNLDESRQNVEEAQQNIAAIDTRQQQVRAEYDSIIRRLSALEHGD